MRPYLAVVKDSFREAMSSRVLPFLLVLFTLALLALAPLGLREETAWELKPADVHDGRAFALRLSRQADADAPSPGKRIWERLPERLRQDLTTEEELDFVEQHEISLEFTEALNNILQQRDLYDPDAWQHVDLGDEADQLLETGREDLSEEKAARLNRLLLDAAYPGEIAPIPGESVKLTYFGHEFFLGRMLSDFAIDRSNVQTAVKGMLAFVSTYFVGKFGVFVAILVTASIIPRMFEPGAIDLLLSKPVSRSALFLTKFFSGCAFIFINAAYFMVGLWLIVGFRFDVWSGNLLLTIPVFLFVFAIVYSISALAGVVWRNAIVSILIALVVWAFCIGIGFTKGVMDGFRNDQRLETLVPADETLIAADKSGRTFRWRRQSNEWDEIFEGAGHGGPTFGMAYPLIGPVYDAEGDQLLAIHSPPAGFGFQRGDGRLLVGRREQDWMRKQGIPVPFGVSSLFMAPEGHLLAVGVAGVYRLEGDPAHEHQQFKLFGFDFSRRDQPTQFISVGPRDSRGWGRPFAAAMHPADGSLALFERGRLILLDRAPDGDYETRLSVDLETDQPAVLAYAGHSVAVALGDGTVRIFDAEDTLELRQEFTPFGEQEPRSVVASSDGRWFGVLFHHERLWLYDAANQTPLDVRTRGRGTSRRPPSRRRNPCSSPTA